MRHPVEGSGLRAAGSECPEGAGWAEGPDGCATRALPVPGAVLAADSSAIIHPQLPRPLLSKQAIIVTWNFSGSVSTVWATKSGRPAPAAGRGQRVRSGAGPGPPHSPRRARATRHPR